MKKLLILTDYPSENGTFKGGIPRAISSWVSQLANIENIFEVHILTLTSSEDSNRVIIPGKLYIHYRSCPLVNYPIIAPIFLIHNIVKKEIDKINPDIINVQGISRYYAIPALKQDRIPVVVTVHGVIHKESETWHGILGRYRAFNGKKIEKLVLRKAKNLIAVSPYVEQIVKPMTTSIISMIPNPVDEKFFQVSKSENTKRILFVGGIEPRKGIHILIEAIRLVRQEIPDIELHIVGNIRKTGYYNNLLGMIENYNLESNVVFMHGLPDVSLMNEYSQASVFVLPSQEESFGIVLLEAMATGTPIIASKVGGIPHVVDDKSDGLLIDYGDYNALACNILNLLFNGSICGALSEKGKATALRYHPKTIATRHLSLFEHIHIN